jgi:hypothetical protein
MSVGIDSMILVYAGLVPANPDTKPEDFDELQVRSKLLLHKLAKSKTTIFLPTIAVSELLVPVPSAQKGLLIASLEAKFVCPPFDLPAAAIAADLHSQHASLPQDLKYTERRVLKADTMIVASARAAGATDFYSHDKRCRALANLIMKGHDLPTNDPEDMFLEGDIRRGEA